MCQLHVDSVGSGGRSHTEQHGLSSVPTRPACRISSTRSSQPTSCLRDLETEAQSRWETHTPAHDWSLGVWGWW